MSGWRGFTLIELMIVIAIIAIVAALAIPGILAATRSANERNASGSLKTLVAAELAFKAGDLDGDFVNNFWTADVAGLYYVCPRQFGSRYPSASSTNKTGIPSAWPPWGPFDPWRWRDRNIRLIEHPIALADSDTMGSYAVLGIHRSSPKSGYWFQNLVSVVVDETQIPPERYYLRPQDRFGFGAFPHQYGSSGKLVFIVNEEGAMYKKDPGGTMGYVENPDSIPVPGQATDTQMDLHGDFDTFPKNPLGPPTVFAAGEYSKMD